MIKYKTQRNSLSHAQSAADGKNENERTEEVMSRDTVYSSVLYLQAVLCSSNQWKESRLGKIVEFIMRVLYETFMRRKAIKAALSEEAQREGSEMS